MGKKSQVDLPIKLFPKQKWFCSGPPQEDLRQNICHGSVRSGKTFVTVFRFIMYVLVAPKGDLIIVGRTVRSIERNVLGLMSELLGSYFKYKRGWGFVVICGRVIHIEGASDARSERNIRGMTLAGAYVDEMTLINQEFYIMLMSRLSVKGAKLYGSTNPDSPYHYLKEDVLDNNKIELNNYQFHIDDNTFLDESYVKNVKNEYQGLFYKRFIEGLWVMAEGAIYDFFDEDEHTIIDCPNAEQYSVSVDYGTNNPTVFLLMGRNRFTSIKYWCEREYFWDSTAQNRQKTDEEYCEDLIKFTKEYDISEIIVDPSAASFIAALEKKGMYSVVHADNSVIDGIRHQACQLKNGTYKIHVSCENTIKEYGSYMWDTKEKRKGADKPIKANDHTKDAERYFLKTMDDSIIYNF